MNPHNQTRQHYQSQAEECMRRAEATGDAAAKAEWTKLAQSWQALADGSVSINLS